MPVAFSPFRGPGAAVPDRVPVPVGDGDPQVDRGLRAAAAARSRARSGSIAPIPSVSPGWCREMLAMAAQDNLA